MVARGGGGLERAHVVAPAAVILGLGHHPRLAQPVEQREEARPRGEEGGRQAGEVDQRRVEELQVALAVEHRKPDRQVGEGLGQGLDEFAQAALGPHGVIGGQRKEHPPAALAVAGMAVVPPPAMARPEPLALRHALAPERRRQVEEHRQRPGRMVGQHGIGRGEIGGVGPDEVARGILAPAEHRGAVHRLAQRRRLVLERRLRQGVDHHPGALGPRVGQGDAEHAVAEILGRQRQPHAAAPLLAQKLDPALARQPGQRLGRPRQPRPEPLREAGEIGALQLLGQAPGGSGRVDQAAVAEQEDHRADALLQPAPAGGIPRLERPRQREHRQQREKGGPEGHRRRRREIHPHRLRRRPCVLATGRRLIAG